MMPTKTGRGVFLAASRFLRNRRGVAAIEFAFIAPFLLSLYFMTMEISQGIESNKKVGRVASMVGDLITQQQTTTKAEIEAVLQIGEAILQPYNRSKPTIIVTAIEITNEDVPQVKVVWSRKLQNGVFSKGDNKGTLTTVPEQLELKGTFLIRVESDLAYKPVLVWTAQEKAKVGLAAAFDNINMGEKYFLRPRVSSDIPCADC